MPYIFNIWGENAQIFSLSQDAIVKTQWWSRQQRRDQTSSSLQKSTTSMRSFTPDQSSHPTLKSQRTSCTSGILWKCVWWVTFLSPVLLTFSNHTQQIQANKYLSQGLSPQFVFSCTSSEFSSYWQRNDSSGNKPYKHGPCSDRTQESGS